MDLKDLLKQKVIIFTGPPLIGKGTQSEILANKFNIPALSTGNLFRSIDKNSKMGSIMNEYMSKGQLIPDSIIKEVLIEEISKQKYSDGFILDGYPREVENIKTLDEICELLGMEALCVINLNYTTETLVNRLRNRISQEASQSVARCDSSEEILMNRLKVFEDKTLNVIDHYKNIRIDIDGTKSVVDVEKEIYEKFINLIIEQQLSNITYLSNKFILNSYIKTSLEKNKERYGIRRNIVFMISNDIDNCNEFKDILSRYGVELIRLCKINKDLYHDTFNFSSQMTNIIGILKEKSIITRCYSVGDEIPTRIKYRDGMKCAYCSVLKFYKLVNEEIVKQKYISKVSGHINLSKKSSDKVADYDDIFVYEKNGYTCHEIKDHKFNNSPRGLNMGKWIVDNLFYKQPKNLKFNPVDFHMDVKNYIETHEVLSNKVFDNSIVKNILNYVTEKGIFFKKSINRRLSNYWNPSLNAGLPLIMKRDEVHEVTYMVHDLTHFMLPDLIYTGKHSEKNKKIYIAWRMLSEAVSLVFADMMFVDHLSKINHDYDYSQRKIYPLFKSLQVDQTNIKEILYANYKYCLLGDDSEYKRLLDEKGSSYETLNEFKNKYEPFFVQDYKWTISNYNNMVKNSDKFMYWWSIVSDMKTSDMITIDELSNLIESDNYQDILDELFEHAFNNIIYPVINGTSNKINRTSEQLSFIKYACGQMFIFAKYNLVDSDVHVEKIKQNIINFHDQSIEMTREIFNDYLNHLHDINMLTIDDMKTYETCVPIFDPMYLSYDDQIDISLIELVNKTFKVETENDRYRKLMKLLMNGKGYDDIFVYDPHVSILSDMRIEHPNNVITFLIAGVSVECSLELIAHKEASVARLTTSKTNAMNNPMYCVYPCVHNKHISIESQKKYILEHIKLRNKFENYRSVSNEVFNIFNIGNKSTALCYSMSLENLHKLFIGRIGYHGNESEIRIVINKMIGLLNPMYQNIIKRSNEYLQMSNGDKYNEESYFSNIEDGKYETRLTHDAKILFDKLNINKELPEHLQFAEFKSRITYLSFSRCALNLEDSMKYLKKILIELKHLSVLSGFQKLEVSNEKEIFNDYKQIYKNLECLYLEN